MASLGCSGVRLLPRGSGRHLYFVRFCSSEMSPATGSKSSRRTSALKRRLLELQSPVNSDQLELRAKYLQFEREFSQKIQLADLSPEQAAIHARHDEAIQSLHFTYDDPATGLKVFTRFSFSSLLACYHVHSYATFLFLGPSDSATS